MSLEAVAWSLRQKLHDPTAKLILISLADHHNASTGECFPSRRRLAEAGCCSESTVKRKLAWLVESGWIVVKRRYCGNGRQTSNAYEIVFDRSRQENGGVQSAPLPPSPKTGEGRKLAPTGGSQLCTPHTLTEIRTKSALDATEASPPTASEEKARRKEIGMAMKDLARSLRFNDPTRSRSGTLYRAKAASTTAGSGHIEKSAALDG
jgi:hypothetical protein